jgi:hypothetical protein
MAATKQGMGHRASRTVGCYSRRRGGDRYLCDVLPVVNSPAWDTGQASRCVGGRSRGRSRRLRSLAPHASKEQKDLTLLQGVMRSFLA